MQAYGLIIALFVNIFSKETNRHLKRGGPMSDGATGKKKTCLAFLYLKMRRTSFATDLSEG